MMGTMVDSKIIPILVKKYHGYSAYTLMKGIKEILNKQLDITL